MLETIPIPTSPKHDVESVSYNGTANGIAIENPMHVEVSGKNGTRAGANMYGGFSIEKFCNAGPLSYTHEDAQGWLDYVRQFTPLNFWYRDDGVRIWAYYEDYDNWQDTYGFDAVTAVYHSGHGAMDANGVFYAPMGADWGGLGCTAISSNMRLGNEHARYIFWSTCLSLRVLDGHTPLRTWSAANLGFRMLFGFETVSWDNPNYGKFFWEEWRKNKSLSTAWLDSSWRIAHDQAPSVVACGATAQEAQDRLFNERYLSRGGVSRNWWHWRWYYASRTSRELQRALPNYLLLAQLEPIAARRLSPRQLAQRFDIEMQVPRDPSIQPDGSFSISDGERSIAYGRDGSIDVQVALPNLANRQQLEVPQATSLAHEAVRRFGLDEQTPLVVDRVLFSSAAGGTDTGSGQVEEPYVTNTIVEFRQIINGLPVITPDAGTVRVSVDNEGKITRVETSARAIGQLHDRPRSMTPTPPPSGMSLPSQTPDLNNYEQKLAAEFGKQMAGWVVKGGMPVGFTTVPDTTEIGYDIRGDEAVVIARKAVEVDFGSGYRKRYWVTTPLFE